MSFLIKDDELAEKIWDNVRNSIKNEFDRESGYNEKYLKTKIKSYKDKITTNFLDDGIPKESSHCISL